MHILTFDIETIPDTDSGRKLYDFTGTDQEVAESMFAARREATGGSDFLPLHLHRIVAISLVLKTPNTLKIWSLGASDSPESEIIDRFFAGIDKFTPTLVSWNGSGFDLPVLHYRSLLHGITAPRYWEHGDEDQTFKWNNYLSRYHYRHTDIMDILASYNNRANAKLDEIAIMLGLPGKMGMDGSKVSESFFAGDIEDIRNYCETDVLNTHLIYLRFLLIQGKLNQQEYKAQQQEILDLLLASDKPHFLEFAEKWESAS